MRCLNRRAVLAFGALAAVVIALEPQWALPVVTLGIALACPVSMMVVMRRGGACADSGRRAEAERLRAEIAHLRRERTDATLPKQR